MNYEEYIRLKDYSNFASKKIREQQKEIERLNNIIFNQNKRNSHQRIANDNLQNKNKELNNIINELNNAYCKVITKCEEMINSRFYMNDIAIKNMLMK